MVSVLRLENIGINLDPALEPVLGQQKVKDGLAPHILGLVDAGCRLLCRACKLQLEAVRRMVPAMSSSSATSQSHTPSLGTSAMARTTVRPSLHQCSGDIQVLHDDHFTKPSLLVGILVFQS